MAPTAIEARQIGKRYRLGSLASSQTTLGELLAGLGGRGRESEEIWALRDVTLDIGEGEAVGFVGRNGAGKSTLLKLIARITEPTEGKLRTRGRVGALLEVGTGFHRELSGRENIFVNGAILGMSRRDMRSRLDDIVEFAGVERFIDTPLKRYSSGMQLRLAFAVAAHIEPEIVVVDEVLAVGDFEFQARCLARMSEMGEEGRTVVFVSHDHGAVARLCSRAVWLERGKVVADGRTGDVLASYLGSGTETARRLELEPRPDAPIAPVAVEVGRERGEPPLRGEPILLTVTLALSEAIPGLDLAFYLQAEDGMTIVSEAWADHQGALLPSASPGRYEVSLEIPGVLRSGTYSLSVWIGTAYETIANDHLINFDVPPRHEDRSEQIHRDRLLQLPVTWRAAATEGP